MIVGGGLLGRRAWWPRCGVRSWVAGETQAQADEEVVDHFIGAWPWHFRLAGAQVRHAVQQ